MDYIYSLREKISTKINCQKLEHMKGFLQYCAPALRSGKIISMNIQKQCLLWRKGWWQQKGGW